MKKITLLAAAVALLASCGKTAVTSKQAGEMAKAEWLLGTWGLKTPKGELTEKWAKANDTVMLGKSHFVVGGKDTVFQESIRLEQTNGKLAYVVTVPGQNGEKPVRFGMTSSTENQLVFENPQHDFPTKIVYNKFGNDSLVAEISGMKKGKPASQQFPMKKQ